MTDARLLRILRVFIQGLSLIVGGLKREAAELKQEIDGSNEPDNSITQSEV